MSSKADIEAVKAVQEATKPEDNTITLSTGVVLRAKKANPLTLVKVLASSPRPKVPIWHNPKMGRDMENPDDPDYIERVQSWKVEISDKILNALILLGTELVSVPKGVEKPESDKWVRRYALLGQPLLPEDSEWRYLTWVTFVAAADEEDMRKIKEVAGRLSGVPESQVAAAENFPER